MRIRSLLALSGAAILLAVPGVSEARSYRYRAIDVDVTVHPDGSMRIVEQRTVVFDGTYRGMFREFEGLGRPGTGFDRITVFGVLEDGRPMRAAAGGQAPGTYVVDASRITWFAPMADETKTFTLDYKIDGHVKRYEDVAELYWNFVEAERGAAVDRVEVDVHLPARNVLPAPSQPVPDAQLVPDGPFPRAWAHGPLEGEVWTLDTATVRATAPNVPDGLAVEVRIAADAAMFTRVPMRPGSRLPAILSEEDRFADEANRARLFTKLRNVAAGAAALGTVGLFGFLFVRFGREHDVEVGPYLRELPETYPPAILGWLWRWGSSSTEDMSATMLDLARRGYLSLEERSVEEGILFKRMEREIVIALTAKGEDAAHASGKPDELQPYEVHVLDLLADVARDRKEVTPETLKAWAKKDPARMQRRASRFKELVETHAKSMRLVESRAGVIAAVIAAGVATIALSIWAFAAGGLGVPGLTPWDVSPAAVVAIPVAIVVMALSPLLRQRTKAGAVQHAQWEAFRRFLKDFSRLHEAPPTAVVLWEQYLVYAIPLGVAEQVIDAMRIHLPKETLDAHGGAFLGYRSAAGFTSMDAFSGTLSSISHSLTASTTAAFSTAPSSSSGGGGGFSGGGGGGGGGGSSGAF